MTDDGWRDAQLLAKYAKGAIVQLAVTNLLINRALATSPTPDSDFFRYFEFPNHCQSFRDTLHTASARIKLRHAPNLSQNEYDTSFRGLFIAICFLTKLNACPTTIMFLFLCITCQ